MRLDRKVGDRLRCGGLRVGDTLGECENEERPGNRLASENARGKKNFVARTVKEKHAEQVVRFEIVWPKS